MSDDDRTILSTRGQAGLEGAPPDPEKPKRNPLVIIGGIGCALLLCAALLVGGAVYFMGDKVNELTAGLIDDEAFDTVEIAATDEPTATTVSTTEPTAETALIEPTEEPTEAVTVEPTEEASPTPLPDPEIDEIVFALDATEDYEPIDPATEFEGEVTEVHAIFKYAGLSPDYTWERVWFLDDQEMLRSEEPWSGADAGIFDYFINAGGEPLSPGKWVLELYVEGELMATGSFVIVGDETEIAAATDEAELEATTEPEDLLEGTDEPSEHDADVETEPTATSAPTATPVPQVNTYKLAYTKWNGVQHNLYVGDTDGSSEQFIIGRAAGPSWTPDGQTIFFSGESGVDRQVVEGVEYVFDGVSNGIVAVTVSPLPKSIGDVQLFQGLDWKDGGTRWANVSPNGAMVAFDSNRSGNSRIYFLGTHDNEQFRFEIIGEQADWSPDSDKIVYRSGRNGTTGIWISNRDDSGHTLITNGGSDSFPAWSPDGETIAFSRDEGGNADIYTVDIDGSNLQRLTDAPGPDTLPTYTPDGQLIFRSARTGSWSIWKMNGDGSNQTEIVSNANVGPDWSYSRMGVLR
ncbi:MAG: PD40 domain-containing protein [Anaerolineae bacterium]|nr:PD40 domain-containing protein [Anaerolineae bacterium]